MTKISDLTDGVTANDPDRIAVARSPYATGDDRYVTPVYLATNIHATYAAGVETFLKTPSSANLASAVTDETGSGALVFANSPTLVTPALGTPASGVATNLTGTASGLTAGNVTTNANLTGHVTSTGNAAVLGSFTAAQLDTAISDDTIIYDSEVDADIKTLTLPASTTISTFGASVVDDADADAAKVTLENERLVQNSQSTAYTLVLGDAGKHILHPSADTTARIFTIPANGAVAYAVGTCVTFINQDSAGVLTIAITTDTMRLAGAGTTGSRTLAANGVATAIKVTSTEWIISGVGLT